MSSTCTICLWHNNPDEMVEYYRGIFSDFKLISTNPMVSVFEILGNQFMCLNHCPPDLRFNEKISFVINVDTQAEIDHYWNCFKLEGKEGQCGWIQDKFGVFWQVVPRILGKLMNNPDTASKVTQAFMQMTKLEIAKLEEAICQV